MILSTIVTILSERIGVDSAKIDVSELTDEVTGFVVAGGYYLNQSYNEAMAACQVKYSYDTCFHSLNR